MSQGVDAKKFSDAYNSFGVVSKTKRADQMAQNFRIRGVPALATAVIWSLARALSRPQNFCR